MAGVVVVVVVVVDGYHLAERHYSDWCLALILPNLVSHDRCQSSSISVHFVGRIDFDGYVYAAQVSAGCAFAIGTVWRLASGESPRNQLLPEDFHQ